MGTRSTFETARRVRLYHRLQTVARVVQQASDREMLAANGLTTAQVAVLAVLEETGPASQRAIGANLGVNEPSVTEMVGRLQGLRCVSKRSDPNDGRARLVDLTGHGRKVLLEAKAPFRSVNAAFAAALSSDEVEILADLLTRVHDQFQTDGRS